MECPVCRAQATTVSTRGTRGSLRPTFGPATRLAKHRHGRGRFVEQRELWAWCNGCIRDFYVPRSDHPEVNRVRCPLCTNLPSYFEGRDSDGGNPTRVDREILTD